MKIRTAIDKAKLERLDETESSGPDKITTVPDANQWTSPVYSRSNEVRLNAETLRDNRCVSMFPDAPELDAFKVLRTQIQLKTKDRGLNTIMITSPGAGEGKTLTAINMSLAFAKEFGQTVLLVDCDLKKQDIHKTLGIPGKRGLVNYFTENRPLEELIVWPAVDKLTLISGGAPVLDSAELLGSPKMTELVQEMKSRYDDRYVFFDVPPVLGSADAIAFARLVDGIVMVVEAGKTSWSDIKKAQEMIPEEKFLGFVLNRNSD